MKKKEKKITEFKEKMHGDDALDICKTKLQEKLFKELKNEEDYTEFFKKNENEIKFVGIPIFRKEIREKIYSEKKSELFSAYKESGIDRDVLDMFRNLPVKDVKKYRELRDSLTPASSYTESFKDFFADHPEINFMKDFVISNPLTTTFLSCLDKAFHTNPPSTNVKNSSTPPPTAISSAR